MNAKRHSKRKATKLTQKVERGSQNRKAVERKSNIAAKRVTLLPGFLVNGFTSKTVQKATGCEGPSKKTNNLLRDDLQDYLEQKGKYPRRSQRILKKHIEQRSTIGSKTSNNNLICAGSDSGLTNLTHPSSNAMSNNFIFKPILKNNSKSLFKEISDRFSKVNLYNTDILSQKPVNVQRIHSENKHIVEDLGEVSKQNFQYHGQNHSKDVPPEPQSLFRIDLNSAFCRNLEKQISVTFKKNVVDKSKENIRKKIETVNKVLEGRALVEEMIVNDTEANETRTESNDGAVSKFYPVRTQNWVYSTPPNQKIGLPQIEECQLQAGVLCHNKSERNLYELKPSFNVKQSNNVPIDNRFMKMLTQVKKTPANFEFKGYQEENMVSNRFQQPWREPAGCGGSVDFNEQKELFLNPNFVNIITRPTKVPRNPIFPNYLGDHAPTPRVLENADENLTELQDFTFIEEGNDFKMQESQPVPEERHKRRLSEEDFIIKRRNNMFITEPVNCDKEKMFNFDSQERNIFDFGKV